MTDYLEEGPGQGEALLQALEAMVLWIPVPDGRTAEADGGTSLPATDLCIQGSFVSPADRREPDREDAPGSVSYTHLDVYKRQPIEAGTLR